MVIINADDFGLSKSVNDAIVQCFENKYINRTTAMVNMPDFDVCYDLAKQHGFQTYVGLHLVLDAGVPLTKRIQTNSHFCKDGVFIKGWFASPVRKFYMSSYDKSCLEEEIGAQMQKFIEAGFAPVHIDSHHFVHTSSPIVINIVCKQASKYGFKSMRTIATANGENIIKRMLKNRIKSKIEKQFTTTSKFAPLSQYPINKDDIEYMCHPDIVNGEVIDFVSRKKGEVMNFKTTLG